MMMRKLLTAWIVLAAIVVASAPVSAWWQSVPQVAIAAGGGFSLTAQGNAGSATTGTNSINYGTVSYGSGCNAVIVLVYWYNSTITDVVSSLTVGGSGATQVAGVNAAVSAGGQSIDMWQLNSPSGSSANITVNYSGNVTYNSNVTAYCLVSTTTAASSTNKAAFSCSTGSPISAAVTVPAGGGAITMTSTTGGATMAFTNATSDSTYTGGGTFDGWGHTTATGSVTVTATPSGSDGCTLGLAAFGP